MCLERRRTFAALLASAFGLMILFPSIAQATSAGEGPPRVEAQEPFELNNFFMIQSKQTRKFLDCPREGPDEGYVQTWDPNGKKNQQWLFVPVRGERQTYYIISRETGEAMDVRQQGGREGHIQTYRVTQKGNQKWKLTLANGKKWPVAGNEIPRGDVKMMCKATGKYLDVALQGPDTGKLQEWDGTGKANQIWTITKPEPFELPEVPVEPELSKASPPVMTSLSRPGDGGAVVTGVQWIAWPFVTDPAHEHPRDSSITPAWRMKHSPYYRLERSTHWRVKEFFSNTSTELTVKKKWHDSSSWGTEVEKSFSVTTGFEAEAGGEAFGGSVKASLSFTASFAETLSKSGVEGEEIEVPIPPLTAVTLYELTETLTLYRMNGDPVPGGQWKTYTGTAVSSFTPETE